MTKNWSKESIILKVFSYTSLILVNIFLYIIPMTFLLYFRNYNLSLMIYTFYFSILIYWKLSITPLYTFEFVTLFYIFLFKSLSYSNSLPEIDLFITMMNFFKKKTISLISFYVTTNCFSDFLKFVYSFPSTLSKRFQVSYIRDKFFS